MLPIMVKAMTNNGHIHCIAHCLHLLVSGALNFPKFAPTSTDPTKLQQEAKTRLTTESHDTLCLYSMEFHHVHA